MYEYPSKLVEYLTEQESEGNDIFTTNSEDGVVWIIKHNGLKKWLTVVEWFEGQEDFDMINVCGRAFDRLYKTMTECKDDN